MVEKSEKSSSIAEKSIEKLRKILKVSQMEHIILAEVIIYTPILWMQGSK